MPAQQSPDGSDAVRSSGEAPLAGVATASGPFADSVRQALDIVETELFAAAEASTPLVSEAARHIMAAGGKRFRPLLVILGSHFGEQPSQADVVKAALVVELTHVASLYHDDVMDDADLRRGAPSANRRWQNSVAIMVGDFLFARASDVVADLGTDFVHLQARTFSRLVQGQIAETVGPRDGDDALEHYLQVVADKTGSLIATSALFGARIAQASDDVQQTLASFGEEIGIVFQLSDDIIDITSDETGKTPGTDLREGVETLPILLVRQAAREVDARLLELLDGDLRDDAALAQALSLIRRHPAIDEARAEVRRRAELARKLLDPLSVGPARAALEELCDTVVTRTT